MPSITDVIFLLLLLSLAYGGLQQRLLGDAGTGWHIRNGQQILATHTIPHADSFSYTMPGHPWFAWEWLYDLGVGLLGSRMGLNGVVFLSALLIAGVFAGFISSPGLICSRGLLPSSFGTSWRPPQRPVLTGGFTGFLP
jgi:hypothetical protein